MRAKDIVFENVPFKGLAYCEGAGSSFEMRHSRLFRCQRHKRRWKLTEMADVVLDQQRKRRRICNGNWDHSYAILNFKDYVLQ